MEAVVRKFGSGIYKQAKSFIEPLKATYLIVTPTTVKLEFGQVQQFVGQVLDQRRNKMLQETVCWTTNGGGTIDQHGNFTAGCSTGKFEIIASVGSIQRFIPISIVEQGKRILTWCDIEV